MDTPLKVAVLLPALEIGGAEQLVLEELTELCCDKRFQFELHVLFAPGPLLAEFAELGIPIVVWKARHRYVSTLLTYLRLAFYLRSNGFQVFHCHLLYLLGPWVGVVAGIRNTLVTVHTKSVLSRMELLALMQSHVVIACGTQVADHLHALRPILPIVTLNNAIRTRERVMQTRNEIQGEFALLDAKHYILSIGRLIPDKGFAVLIQAMRTVSKLYPDVVLLIAGEGPERSTLEVLISEMGLQQQVQLLGVTRKVDQLLAHADVYVNASHREGLSISLLEAMMHGKPIIATRAGGNSDLITDQESGILVDPGAVKQLAEAITGILQDQDLRTRYGAAAQARFKNDFDIKRHCAQLSQLYRFGGAERLPDHSP